MQSAEWLELLATGAIDVLGAMRWSSNATFLVSVTGEENDGRAIYKPGRGERPLWDFPDEIFRREVAAYELSLLLGLELVPETTLREEGPYGEGSIQRFIEADFEQHYFTLLERREVIDDLRVMAAFDVVANNADRKGGHVLIDADNHIWGIDHGLCFHVEPKLRTVIWDFAGEPLPRDVVDRLAALVDSDLTPFDHLLEEDEVEALLWRTEELLADGRYPTPDGLRRPYPSPLV